MTIRLVTEGRVVRRRRPAQPGLRGWVIHLDTCEHAGGCAPLADLVAELGSEQAVFARVRAGLIHRCTTCRPTLVSPQ